MPCRRCINGWLRRPVNDAAQAAARAPLRPLAWTCDGGQTEGQQGGNPVPKGSADAAAACASPAKSSPAPRNQKAIAWVI